MTARRRLMPALGAFLLVLAHSAAAQTPSCPGGRVILARVAAVDAPFPLNRLGAMMTEGMTFALQRDVVETSTCPKGQQCPRATLREGKRPRPIVLRANLGDCLLIEFKNLLSDPMDPKLAGTQPATRHASIHVAGLQLFDIKDDGSFVGTNASSVAAPGETRRYFLRATAEGTFMLNSQGAAWGGKNAPNDGAQVTAGLFGAVNVEPKDAVWLRSQITRAEMLSAVDTAKGNNGFTTLGQPLLNFASPVLNMLQSNADGTLELVSTDLTAVIAGPATNGYMFPDSDDPNTSPVPYEPQRRRPFREFTIEYHELSDSVQAFPAFDAKSPIGNVLSAGGDAFAINYGTGGISAEIVANRFGLGPMNSCADCRFEEFFLSSWTVGDPAMIVDFPANAPCTDDSLNHPETTNKDEAKVQCTPGVAGNAPEGIKPQRKATLARYPEDPSNVYHSYINDRVIFRTLHAGTGVSHVHHLHAHQWFHSPNADGSTYLDSQLINPGSAYTMEIAHLGSGNVNKVVGDSIFHCHFYPHFAAGMWAHWRSHDVFELGTELDANGKPISGWNRALPDGEIAAGTPIPALVPMPGLAMAPAPARVRIVPVQDPNDTAGPVVGYRTETNPDDLKAGLNPGFPFFIPGIGGTRAPHPPMDFAKDEATGKELNGGLPRHILVNAAITDEEHTYINFEKDMDHVNAYRLPEEGTDEEKVAMNYHAQCTHPTFNSLGGNALYRTNGRPPVSGAPYADPGVISPSDSDVCPPLEKWINYKAAVVQTDIVLNKLGWHYPQSRLLTLWGDVVDTLNGTKPPEPFFIRANSHVGVNYWHTNLVPDYYLLDDYQVRTPTDIIGQHIHLVKFDVTSSDGAANGYNYEDGTLSFQDVQARIEGINECGGLAAGLMTINKCSPTATGRVKLMPEPPPAEICTTAKYAKCDDFLGAQTTVQRWYADPLSSEADKVNGERTLRTVFTHDHFGPSTHQQVGLYAALLVEPTDSQWFLNDPARTPMRTRPDGGPTSWEAIIETPGNDRKNTYREFALALQDFQFAYLSTSMNAPKEFTGTDTNDKSVPGGLSWSQISKAVEPANGVSNSSTTGPTPQIVSSGPTAGTLSFNYRNEPLAYRVQPGGSNDPRATDLSYVFASNITRNNSALNSQPTPGKPISQFSMFKYPAKPLTPGMLGGDPYTPLLRAYEGDRVQVRVIVGAHMLPHDFTIHGIKWLFEPSFNNSGYRNNQSMGISEHFEFVFDTPRASPAADDRFNWSDYLYMTDASNQKHGIVDGMWGLFRAYKTKRDDLPTLSTNTNVKPLPAKPGGYSCPPTAPVRAYTVNAASPSTPMVYNNRGAGSAGRSPDSKIVNPMPLLYTFQSMTAPGGSPTAAVPNSTEPLVLRANAGECIQLTLANKFNTALPVFGPSGSSTAAYAQDIPLMVSKNVGLTPALLSHDVMNSAGMNIGWNPAQTVATGGSATYKWYAGQTNIDVNGNITGTPIELAGVNLTPSDPLQQDLYGLVGGLVVEPPGSIACWDTFQPPQPGNGGYPTYASATIYNGGTCAQPGPLRHREFVLITQDDTTPKLGWPTTCYCAVPVWGQKPKDCQPCFTTVTSTISTIVPLNTAVNYRTEPMAYRMNIAQNSLVNSKDLWKGFSDSAVLADPETPIFAAAKNTPTRLHLLHPGGSGDQQVMNLHGHVWQELPFIEDSTKVGDNRLSMWLGARDNHGTNTAYVINLDQTLGGAGGNNGVVGDFQYRTSPGNFISQGLWGLMRVGPGGSDIVRLAVAQLSSGGLQVAGSATVFVDNSSNPKNGQRTSTITLSTQNVDANGNPVGAPFSLGTANVGENGLWNASFPPTLTIPNSNTSVVVATSPLGGRATMPILFTNEPSVAFVAPVAGPPVRDSIRFFNVPRETPEDPSDQNVPEKPESGLPAPPSTGSAPKPPAG